MNLYRDDPSSMKSPQGQLMDELLWDRMSSFWKRYYREEDREALNAVYEGYANVLDAEYVRAKEINDAKSLLDCPIFSQRRWVRLDLNQYDDVKGFIQSIVAGASSDCTSAPGTSADGSVTMACVPAQQTHAAHWHISFSFVIQSNIRTIELGYPVEPNLVEIHRTYQNGEGRTVGSRLRYGTDFVTLPTGIQLNEGDNGDVYDIVVGFDFSNVSGLLPNSQVAPILTDRTVSIPVDMSNGYPVHVMVVRGGPPVVTSGIEQTNTSSYATNVTFIPWTGNSDTGAALGAPGVLTLPADVALAPSDTVLVFGLRNAPNSVFDTIHSHGLYSFYLAEQQAQVPPSATFWVAQPGAVSSVVVPNGVIPLGLFGSIDYLSQQFDVYLDGEKLSRNEYNYVQADNTLYFRLPVSTASSARRVDILFTQEYNGDPVSTADLHVHYGCSQTVGTVDTVFAEFDDNESFDCDPEEVEGAACAFGASGVFDSGRPVQTLVLQDYGFLLSSLRVYADGLLLAQGPDFAVSVELPSGSSLGSTRLTFFRPLAGSTITVYYVRAGNVNTYGVDDLLATSRGCGPFYGDIDRILLDPASALHAYQQQVGRPVDARILLEAARILAAGGNPMLALFHDEFPEYAGFPLDAPGQPLTALQARTLESSDTDLISIPVLVDHPYRPTVRLLEGVDYRVVDGQLSSSRSLTAPRSAADDTPGIWWCPVLVLDERMLAKNFGALIGDIRPSTAGYRDALLANFQLRFGGATIQNTQWAAAVLAGSPRFRQDTRITSVREVETSVNITYASDTGEQTINVPAGSVLPRIGDVVFAGQSALAAVRFIGTAASLVHWSGSSFTIGLNLGGIEAGDTVRIELRNPDTGALTWATFTVSGADQLFESSTETFQTRVAVIQRPRDGFRPIPASRIRIYRNVGAPFISLNGAVQSISAVKQWELRTADGASYLLPESVYPAYRPGDLVSRGQPVDPSRAVVYDDRIRPNWYLANPAEEARSWSFLTAGASIIDSQGVPVGQPVSVRAAVNGISRVVPSTQERLARRGDQMVLTLASGEVRHYTVTGNDGSDFYVVPAEASTVSGEAEFLRSGVSDLPTTFQTMLLPPLTTQLASPQAVGSNSLQLVTTASFPAQGRLLLRHPGIGSFELDYSGVAGNFVTGLVWTPYEILTGLATLDTTWEVSVIIAYSTELVSPAFTALCQRRVEFDFGSGTGQPRGDLAAAADYYRVFKNSAFVIEVAPGSSPRALREALEDTMPAWMSVVALYQHNIVDIYEGQASDAGA